MLLGGLVAGSVRHLDDDDSRDLFRLIGDVEAGRRIPQPRLRHRFQRDRIGLRPSCTRLVADTSGLIASELDDHNGTGAQHALSAVYAARTLAATERAAVLQALRTGMAWVGPIGPDLLAALSNGTAASGNGRNHMAPAAGRADPVGWAMQVLELATVDGRPGRSDVQQAFRNALRGAHPDHGAPLDGAAHRIAELETARRILLA